MDLRASLSRWFPNPLRLHLLAIFVLSLAFGVALYAMPDLGAIAWPYETNPLATRFFACVLLAIALAAILAMREPLPTPMNVLMVMSASVFSAILIAAAVDVSRFTAHVAVFVLWFVLMGALVLGSAYVLLRARSGPPAAGAVFRLPRWLRIHLLVNTAVVLFFSVQMLVGPGIARAFWPWTVSDPVMRGIGGLFTGVAIGTGYSYIQHSWDKVRLLLPVNVLFVSLVLLAVGLHWSIITAESPGWQVTIPWLVLYVYTAAYPVYYLIRPPTPARGAAAPTGATWP